MRRRRPQEEASSRGRERDWASGAASGLGPGRARGEGARGALPSWQELRDAQRSISPSLPCTMLWLICCPLLCFQFLHCYPFLRCSRLSPCSLLPSFSQSSLAPGPFPPLQLVLAAGNSVLYLRLEPTGKGGGGSKVNCHEPVVEVYSVFAANVKPCHAT